MTLSTVTIPKQVATAIETLRSAGMSNLRLLYVVSSSAEYSEPVNVIREFIFGESDGEEVLLSALVNGYTVDGHAEVRIREYFEFQQERVDLSADYKNGIADGIIKTLNIFGKKIEGINGGDVE